MGREGKREEMGGVLWRFMDRVDVMESGVNGDGGR